MHTFTFKASDDVFKKLTKFAEQEERPKSYLIRKAVEAYLAEMEEDEADLKLALERLDDPESEYITLEDYAEQHGLEIYTRPTRQ